MSTSTQTTAGSLGARIRGIVACCAAFGLLEATGACLAVQAGQLPVGQARTVAVSMQADAAHDGDAADSPGRTDLQRMFKARCPGRVERLLSMALPAERPDFKAIADICTCAASSLQNIQPDTPPDRFKVQAAQAALACSKDTITARNEVRTHRLLGPYLTSQGLTADQVAAFSQCAATTHWRNTVALAASEQPQTTAAWWGACSEQVGHKGLAEPGLAEPAH